MLNIIQVIVLSIMSAVILSGCDPDPITDLEIVDIAPEEAGPYSLGEVVRLLARVRNTGDEPVTIALAVSIRPVEGEAGLIRRGIGREILPGETEQVALELSVEDQFLKKCELKTVVFLANPDMPSNINSIWVDNVPENNSQEVAYPVPRPILRDVNILETFQEIVEDPIIEENFQHHYEARMAYQPVESYWSVYRIAVQTRNSAGEPIEVLGASSVGSWLRTESILWDRGEERRNSVTQANVRFYYRDCEGTEMELDKDGISVQLSPI